LSTALRHTRFLALIRLAAGRPLCVGRLFTIALLLVIAGTVAAADPAGTGTTTDGGVPSTNASDAAGSAGPSSADAAPRIQLATIDPGDVYWQRFGHNTLIVSHSGNDDDALSFNFGFFDFEQPDFFTRFLEGRMLYQALALPAPLDLGGYVEERRSVHLQSLALTPSQATRLSDALVKAVQPENRDYLYEYFKANCSTRIRDALDAALDGAIKQQTIGRSRGYTYRMHAARLSQGDFWLATGIDLGLGPNTDRPLTFWDEMFIPELMRRHLRDVITQDGAPLVAEESAWFDSGEAAPPELATSRSIPFAMTGCAIAIFLLWLAARSRSSPAARRILAWAAAILHLLFGLAGSILLFLWLGTDHVAAHRNENLLLLNPLSLLIVPAWIFHRGRPCKFNLTRDSLAAVLALSAALAFAIKAVPEFSGQANLAWCFLLIPIHLALAHAWKRLRAGESSESTAARKRSLA